MNRLFASKRVLLLSIVGMLFLLVLVILLVPYPYSQLFDKKEPSTTDSNTIESRYMSEINGIETSEDMRRQYERHPDEHKYSIEDDLVVMFAYPDVNIRWTGMVFIHHFPSVSEIALDYDGNRIHEQVLSPEARRRFDELLNDKAFVTGLQSQMSEIWDLNDPGSEVLDLVSALEAINSKVEFLGGRPQTLFDASLYLIRLGEQDILVYEFEDEISRRNVSDSISPDGYEFTQQEGEVTTVIHIEYVDQPNYWVKERLLVQYIGIDQVIIDLLTYELGYPITTPSNVHDDAYTLTSGWQTYSNPYFKISLKYPAYWQHVDGEAYYGDKYAGDDGFFTITAMGGEDLSLDQVVESEVKHKLQPYGPDPYIEQYQVQGQEASLILPSSSQDDPLRWQAALLVPFPQPISLPIGDSDHVYSIFALYADPTHIGSIAETLKFEVDGMEESEPNHKSEGDKSCLSISDISLEIICPNNYSLTRIDEQNRRGSFAAFRFQKSTESLPPTLKEIQFFTAESINSFTSKCEETPPCFFGTYPSPTLFSELMMAYGDREPYQDYMSKVFADRYFLVKNIPCHGDSCVIREYVSFFKDVMMVVWVAMEDDTQSNFSDQLLNQVFFVND